MFKIKLHIQETLLQIIIIIIIIFTQLFLIKVMTTQYGRRNCSALLNSSQLIHFLCDNIHFPFPYPSFFRSLLIYCQI